MVYIRLESPGEEVPDLVGRVLSERSEGPVRQAYTDKTLKTGKGYLRLLRPRVQTRWRRPSRRPWSAIWPTYLRWLCGRDVDETITDEHGGWAPLSRSSVSHLTERLYEE